MSPDNPSINRGLITSSDGGNLTFTSGDFDNSPGLIEPQDGGTVTVGGSATVTGGLFHAADGGTIKFASSGSIVNGLLQSTGTGSYQADSGAGFLIDSTNQSSITVSGGADLHLAGTITNEGDISAINPGNATTDLRIDGATQLTGGGTVTLGGVNTTLSRITDPSGADGVLTNINNTIQGKGLVGTSSVQIINQAGGTIDANDSTGSLTLAPVTSSSFINRGLLTASNGGTLIFGSGQYDNAGAVIDLQDGSTINFGSGATITGGIVRDLGTGEYVSSSAATLADLTVQGDLSIRNGNDIRLVGTIRNEGEISAINPGNANTDMLIDGATRFEGGGTVTLGGPNTTLSRIIDPSGADGVLTNINNTIQGKGNVGSNSVQIINQAGGTIDANVSGTLLVDTSAATLENAGTLRASNGGLLDIVGPLQNNGTLDAQAGSTIRVDDLVNTPGGYLAGGGIIDAAATVTNQGTISPGNSAGTLSITAGLTLEATSLVEIELESSTSFDILDVSGDVQVDGQLSLELLNGYLPASGDVFDIVTSNTLSGAFANIAQNDTLFTLDKSGVFTVEYTASTVRLTDFTTVPDCDFDNNGDCDGADIDQLVADIATGLNSTQFDMNGNGIVDGGDLNEWLIQAGEENLASMNPYLVGDANLDGAVDGQDFLIWNAAKFTAVAAWTAGDFNADGTVDGQDFLLWNANKFLTSDGFQAVPEPSFGCFVILALGYLGRRRR